MDKRFFEFPAKMSNVIAIFGIYETWAMSVIPGSSYNFNVTTPKGNLKILKQVEYESARRMKICLGW